MPYIGNQPFGKTVRTVTTETITSVKTAYYPNGGYMAGYVDVYVNGVRLSESLDFTATDGSLVTLLYSPSIGDTVEIVTYGSVEIANAVRRSGDTFSGNVYVGSNVYISTSTISVGNATVNTQITAGNIALNGSTLTIGNSTVNTVFTGDTVTVGGTLSLGNTAITGTANVTTAINVGANVSMNTTSIRVGNSTVNTYIVSDTIYGPSTLYIDPAAAGDNTGLVIVKGDLQVDGTTFTINSANVTVNDKNVVLASGAINNAATDGAGLTIYGTNANLTYNATGNNFEMSRGLNITGTANVSVGLNVGANVNLSTSQINVGNSTVNTVITSTALTKSSNTATFGTAVYIAANGNVGIGASSPTQPLEIRTATDKITQFLSGSGTAVQWQTINDAKTANVPLAISALEMYLYTNGSERVRIDSSGNLGLGVTPSAWGTFKAIELPSGIHLGAYTGSSNVFLGGNSFYNGSNWIYKANGAAARYQINAYDGSHYWYSAASGTANTTITFSIPMVLDASGNLGVGISSPLAGYRGHFVDTRAADSVAVGVRNLSSSGITRFVLGNDIGYARFTIGYNGSTFASNPSTAWLGTEGTEPLWFKTNDTEAMRINSTGSISLNGPSGVHVIRRKTVNGSNGIKIQANAADTVSDTNPGASIQLGGGSLTDTYEGNVDLIAYGAVADANRNQIRFSNRSGVNTVTERMRIDHNGDVLIGRTSTRSSAKLDVFGETIALGGNATYYGTIGYNAGTGLLSLASETGGGIRLLSGATERMSIDTYGNVRLGYNQTNDVAFGRYFATSHASGNRGAVLRFVLDDGSQAGMILYNVASSNPSYNAQYITFHTHQGGISAGERARIDPDGNFFINKTSQSVGNGFSYMPNMYGTGIGLVDLRGNSTSNNDTIIQAYRTANSTYAFFIQWSGQIYSTSTSILSTSDASLKQNIRPLETGLSEILALQPRRFDWIDGRAQDVAGFVAQEVQPFLPDLIENAKFRENDDGTSEYKLSIRMSDMIPTMVKAIQEQQALITQLTARIAALES